MASINDTVALRQEDYSPEEIARLHVQMNARALKKRRIRKGALVAANVNTRSSVSFRCSTRSAFPLCLRMNCLPWK